MATRNFAKYFAAAFLAVACTVQDPTDTQAPTDSEPVSSKEVSPKVYIQFSEDMADLVEADLAAGVPTKSAGLNTAMDQLGIESLERVFPDAGVYEARSRKAGLHRFYTAVLKEKTPATKAAQSLEEVPGIVSAHPGRRFRLRAYSEPGDREFSRQWNLYNRTYSGADINVRGVWEKYTTGNSNVLVVVIDEPVSPDHQDLQGNLWKDENGHTGYNFARGNWNMGYEDGDTGHGAHVAGIIGAVSNNGLGIAGIAGGDYSGGVKGVRIISCAMFSGEEYASNEGVAQAFKFGADHGAVISQNSWGIAADGIFGDEPDDKVTPEELAMHKSISMDTEPEIKAAVDYFLQFAGCDADGNQLPDSPMKGGLVFFAAGNEGHLGVDYDPYGSYEPVISVGATDIKGQRAYYSNYGPWVDIAAPGGSGEDNYILSTWPYEVSEKGLGGMVGTSQACPHASGVAALIVSYFGGPGFTADAAKEILYAGLGETVGGDKPVGRKLDALASFEYGVLHYPAGGSSSSDPEAPVLQLEQTTVTVRAHQEVVLSFTAYDPNGDAITLNLEPGSRALSMDRVNNKLIIDGWKDNPGTYKATLTASDGHLFTQATLDYTLLPNHAPQLVGEVGNMLLTGLQRVGSVPLSDLFYDEDGEALSVTTACSNTACVGVSVDGNRILVSPVGYGDATVDVKASDFMGEEVSVSFRVAVINPDQPVRVTPEVASTDAYINIETETPVAVTVKLYSSTGALVLEKETEASAFDPVHLDVSALAPGRYTAEVYYNDVMHKLRIIKY